MKHRSILSRSQRRLREQQQQQEQQNDLFQDPELMKKIEELCNSKAREFRMYGYENVTGEQIWACVSENYRRGWPRLNRLVNDILSLKANRFMNWLMLSVYKDE